MGEKVLKIVTTILIILTMTIGNFMLICANVVAYAVDSIGEVSTNHKNVEFSAVLQNATGEENTDLDVKTDESDLKLHMKVTVKQEGYFTGTIVLDTANFKLKSEILSEGITKIEGNTILLSQINAGETRDLLVGIEPIKEEAFDLSLLNMESKINLRGIYRDSSEKDIEIEGTRTIKLELVSPYTEENVGNILKQEMITNKVITESGENKRIIQMEIESGLEGNQYPVEEEKLEIQVPKIEDKNPERIEISTMEELVTNGKKIEEGEYTYNEEEGKIEIDIKNEAEENKVVWKKEGTNKIIVTYIYGTEAEIEKQEIEVKAERKLYDANKTVITGGYTQEIIQEDKDNVVRVEVKNTEDNIYKGKIQEGIEREITEEVGIEVTAKGIANKIEIEEDNSEINLQNVYARRTVINKEEIDSILGETGSIEIRNSDTDEVITTIDKSTEVDENGKILTIEEAEEIAKAMATGEEVKTSEKIVIEYPENVERVKIVVNNAEKAGRINVENTKVIKENTRGEVQAVNNINYIINGKYYIEDQENSVESKKATINLLNTETSVRVEVNKTELSTMTENTGVEIRAVLRSNNEKYDLYKNPTISIKLPEVVQGIKVNSINLLNAENEMQITNPRLNTEERTIEMTLGGEQKKYKDEAVEGPTIIINADLTLNKKAGNSIEKIIVNYTNEKVTAYEGGIGAKEVEIAVKSYAGVITTTEIEEYGISTVNNQGTKEGKIEIEGEAKTATLRGEVINNNGTAITNVRVVGTYPTKEAIEGNNIDIAVSDITVEGIDLSRVKIYYTENSNATEDVEDTLNGWTEELNDGLKVKKYLIQIDKMENKEEINYSYMMQIPGGLEYSNIAKQGYIVKYLDSNLIEQNVNQDLVTIKTGDGPVVETTLKAFNGPKEVKDTVYEGTYLTYQITATNIGSETATNISLVGQVPPGTVYVENKGSSSGMGDLATEGGLVEDPSKKSVEFNIDNLEPGESIVKEYIVKISNDVTNIQNKIEIKYGEIAKESNIISLNVNEGQISVKIFSVDIGNILIAGYGYSYVVVVENLSEEELHNVDINIDVGELEFVKARAYDGDDLITETFENNILIDSMEANKTINIIVDVTVPVLDVNSKTQSAYTYVTVNDNTYYSNEYTANIRTYLLQINNTSPNSGEYVKAGDEITYDIEIYNNDSEVVDSIRMKDTIPDYINPKSIIKNGVELSENDYYISNDYTNGTKTINVDSDDTLKPGEKIYYHVTVSVDEDISVDEITEVVNTASIYYASIELDSSTVTHIIVPSEPGEPTDPDDPNNPNDPSDPSNPSNPSQSIRIVSGTAWLDSNENGQRDENETTLSGITVRILNTETNELLRDSRGEYITARTNNNGFYTLTNIPQGRYIVIFEYDTTKYMITDFEKAGVSSQFNSKVIEGTLNMDGESRKVGITETIEVRDSNIANINIGLKEAKVFDLRLDKYVNRIIVQNSKGTTTNEYGESTLAKAEIDAKLINNTNVVVEYTLRVTNEGEVPGYVGEIVDYVSSEYKFSSELNSDWYEQNGRLYNVSLMNEEITPGESREVKLTLTKKMTENSTGLISNTAEIAESYNVYGLKDIDSTENNNATGEDDIGKADVILSIKTGQVITTIGIVFVTIAIIGIVSIVIIKIINKRNE